MLAREESNAPSCKRARVHSLAHDSFPQEAPLYVDRLKHLYPHSRDQDCYLDDKLHQYYVHGEPYGLSVTGWWEMCFEKFDATRRSNRIVQGYLDKPGFRCSASEMSATGGISESILASSVYNFAQHLRIFERREDNDVLDALQDVAVAAKKDYAGRYGYVPFSAEAIVSLGRRFLADPQKPQGPLCYYLMLLYIGPCDPDV